MRTITIRIPLLIFFTAVLSLRAQAQFEELSKFIPARANAVAFLNMEEIYGSDFAFKNQWLKDGRIHFPTCPLHYPDHTKRLVLAAEFDLLNMNSLWEASFFEMAHKVNVTEFEVFANNPADEIGGLKAVETPGRSFLVKLSDRVMANVFPANRQFVGRQLGRPSERGIKATSPYIQEAFSYASHANDPAEMILAIDLSNVVSKGQIERFPYVQEFVKKNEVDPELLAETLAGIKGLMLGVRIEDKPFGKLKLDFSSNADVLSKDGKTLVLQMFRGLGIMIDEFEDWSASVNGTEFSMEGYLGDVAIQQIASVIDPPGLHAVYNSRLEDTEADSLSLEAFSTKEHFNQLDELVRQLRTRKSDTMGATAFFYERYARKIDRLPVLSVDDEMLDYSAAIANLLRDVAAAERGMAVSSAAVGKQIAGSSAGSGGDFGYRSPYSYGYRSGYYGYYAPRSYSSYRRAAAAGIIEEGAKRKYELFAKIDEATGEIRRKMVKKYGIEF